MTPRWHLHIDTGGTFTDCLAHSPTGEVHRSKVLSNGTLRGKVLARVSKNVLRVQVSWNIVQDIFAGYAFQLIGTDHPLLRVQRFDGARQEIHLETIPADIHPEQHDFLITAKEEAPVLAARLVTRTPLHQPLPPIDMRLGTTRGTNAMLERKGASTAILLTRGFCDLLAIGTQQRPDIFALNIIKPLPYYTTVIEVAERLDARGQVVEPLAQAEIERIIRELRACQAETVAVALLHSYRNPVHENSLIEALQQADFPFVSGSADLAPTIKILPRAKTALVNAYLSPIIRQYLDTIRGSLTEGSLNVMTSAGGLTDANYFRPKDSLLSGPAGGVVGAASVLQQVRTAYPGMDSILTLDMGGTSTDVSRYAGEYDYRYITQVGDIELASPSLAIETVAAGGGSVCAFDGYQLTVGPESAGAQPGPACYGLGGPLTLTDLNLLLGRLQPDSFGIPIRKGAAQQALADLQHAMREQGEASHSDEAVLLGLLRIANEKMTEAIRKISVRRGYDPAQHALLAFGGAGGQHATAVAELLGCKQVIIPQDAGLLSAYGMGYATVERFASEQVLQPLDEIEANLPATVKRLTQQACGQLQQEGYRAEQITVRLTQLFLRFRGQEACLEINYQANTHIQTAFRSAYESLYGHWLEDQVLEVESVKVVVSTLLPPLEIRTRPTAYQAEAVSQQTAWTADGWQTVSVYSGEALQAGASLIGPALVSGQHATIWIDTGWKFSLDAYRHALLIDNRKHSGKSDHSEQPEAAQLSLFMHRFAAIAASMGALLERTSFSVNVKERLDFSCALLDAEGKLVVNAPHIPVHLGSLGLCVRQVQKHLPMKAGDVVITNHPGYGGSHLPDITLISPVFIEKQLVGYMANRAHHAEVGGKRPGSMPPDATTLAEEGVVITPTYLIRQGVPQWEAIEQLLTSAPYPTRSLAENLADLNGALASIRWGREALQQLCVRHTIPTVRHYMTALQEYTHARLQEAILAAFPTGSQLRATEYLDDGTPLQVAITLNNEKIMVDFSGSGGVHPGNLNATLAIVNSVVMYVLRLLMPEPIPLNEGLMQGITLRVPTSLLNPPFPDDARQCPAVVGGNTETSQRLTDTLLKALGLAAGSQGTMNNLLFGNDRFGYYETIGGGAGAGPDFCGADAVHQHMTNTRITDPEVLEFRYPVRLNCFAIRSGSGGAGRRPGGNGIVRQLTFLEPVSLTVLTQHRKQAPYSLAGGQPGQTGKQYIIRQDGTTEPLAGIDQAEMQTGDAIIIETPGGGGYGEA